MKPFTEPTEAQRQQLLNDYGIPYDRIVREQERREITGVSRATAWEGERTGQYPRRRSTGKQTVGWLLSDLLFWIRSREEK